MALGIPNIRLSPRTAMRWVVVLACTGAMALAGGSAARAGLSPSAQVTKGSLTLTATPTDNLSEQSTTITVTGSGYNPGIGIYVTLCVMRPEGEMPSPCGGFRGENASAVWISTHPEANFPMPSNGTFTTTLTVGPELNSVVDCRAVRCAVVTRTDHTRLSDRSYDVQIPVTFQGVAPTTTTTTTTTTTIPKKSSGSGTSGSQGSSAGGSSTNSSPDTQASTTVPVTDATTLEVGVDDVIDDLKDVALESEESSNFGVIIVAVIAAAFLAGVVTVPVRKRGKS